MNVELINDEEPGGLRISSDGVGNMLRKVFLGPAWPDSRRYDFSRRYIEVGDQALRPVTEVFILRALDETWLHR
jgi:hypothetical protein